ncbi:MAG TPA: DUF4397 domain-containing protein [Gemmatimonadaceae bacterium]|nr:DUF4397 domain-containing protein [Gemmatimonadaceae bacterium]
MKVKYLASMSTLPLVVAVLFTACSDGPTAQDTMAKVRFFNAVWNAQDNIGFTMNTQFATGSSLPYLQSTQTCASFDPGTASFAIGLANATGTGLNSNALAMLENQIMTAGGNYTVLSGGNLLHPSLVLVDNKFTGTLGANQAAVRFVNLAAASEGPIDVSKGTAGTTTTVVQTNMGFRDATPFSVVTSGDNTYTITYNTKTEPLLSGADATLNLQAGTVNIIVISRLNPPDGKFTLVNLHPCS